MPTKRNFLGEQQEYVPAGSSKGGEYSGDPYGNGVGQAEQQPAPQRKSAIDSFIDNDLSKPSFSVESLGEEFNQTKKIKDEKTFIELKDKISVVGKDGKTYSYSEGFVKNWIDGVKDKSKRLETFDKSKEETGGGMSAERVAYDKQQIQEEIKRQENKLRKNGAEPKYERKATFVFGLPAAGKSTIADPLKQETGSFEIDADLMKARIPEFQKDPQMVSAVHEESSWMSKQMNDELINKGANLVIGKVGGEQNYNSISRMISRLKKEKYDIDIVVVHTDVDKALESNLGRFINRYIDYAQGKEGKPPRIVNYNEIFNTQATYFDTAEKFYNQGLIENMTLYDVRDRKNPKVIKQVKKGNN